jgi:tripartite-type tricarboxylate transporter receptor subunit TctC
MVAPRNTPTQIVAKLADGLGKTLDDPVVQRRLVEFDGSALKDADRGPAGLQKLVENETAGMTPIIRAGGGGLVKQHWGQGNGLPDHRRTQVDP